MSVSVSLRGTELCHGFGIIIPRSLPRRGQRMSVAQNIYKHAVHFIPSWVRVLNTFHIKTSTVSNIVSCVWYYFRRFPHFHVVGLDCFGSCSGQIWTIAEDKQVLMISYPLYELRKRPSLIHFHPFSSGFPRNVIFHVWPHSKRPRLDCFPPHLPNEATRSPATKGHATPNMKLKDIRNNRCIDSLCTIDCMKKSYSS